MKALYIVLFIITAHSPIFASEYISQETGEDCTQFASYEAKADQLYRQKNYKEAINLYQEAISLAELCFNKSELEINNKLDTLYNSIALAYLKLEKPLKAKAYLSLANPSDKKTIFNQKIVQKKIIDQPVSETVARIYWQYAGFGNWSTISVAPANDSLWNISYHGFYITNPYKGGINTGKIGTTLPIKNNQATYTNIHSKNYLNCSILFEFNKNILLTTTDTAKSDCGFGHNVYIGGTYQRVEP